jgi:hypothetical protein
MQRRATAKRRWTLCWTPPSRSCSPSSDQDAWRARRRPLESRTVTADAESTPARVDVAARRPRGHPRRRRARDASRACHRPPPRARSWSRGAAS